MYNTQHRPGNWLICRAKYRAKRYARARKWAGWLDSLLLSKTVSALLDKLYNAFQDPLLWIRHGILRSRIIDKEVEFFTRSRINHSTSARSRINHSTYARSRIIYSTSARSRIKRSRIIERIIWSKYRFLGGIRLMANRLEHITVLYRYLW